MKHILHLVFILMFATLVNCQNKSNTQTNFTQVESSKVNIEDVLHAKELSNKILTAQKNGGFYSLNVHEATTEMINGLNENLQKTTYQRIKASVGDYKSLNFESVYEGNINNPYKIFRFKGVFTLNVDVEVRAVFNLKGKLAGFFVKPWKETL